MPAKVLMFQGTGSDVGKSTLVAGLCRLARQRGIRVAPFKPQNMSNNAAACPTGGEIGRAQALQARAAGLEPEVNFNPVLLKPQSDRTAQIVVQGKVIDTLSASDYMTRRRHQLLDAVLESYHTLSEQYELILVEGAGSAAETNLRSRDIANMGFATAVKAPVCLIGDIDKGGVIASVVGTKVVIDDLDRQCISSFIINKFRGDPALFTDGVRTIEEETGWPCRGVVPWISAALKLPQEDAVVLENPLPATAASGTDIRIAVPMLSRIANFDDMDPLRMHPGVDLFFVSPGTAIPQTVDAIILPGTKSTLGDLQFLKQQGWHHDIIAFARNGGRILGLCGGYQLLGQQLSDPHGTDGTAGQMTGLGLLDVETIMHKHKHTRPVAGRCARSGADIHGYEIHTGRTRGKDTSNPMLKLEHGLDGAISADGRIEGTYVHGLFSSDAFRDAWLGRLRSSTFSYNYEATVDAELNNLAKELSENLDIEALFDDAV